jgi:hypothetical protein
MRRELALLGAFAVATAACGHRARDKSADFVEKSCGTISEARTPSPAPLLDPVVLSATAYQKADGDLTVLVNPIVDQDSGQVTTDLDPSALEIRCGGDTFQPTAADVHKVDKDHPAVSDIVFVIDTTGSMIWAIDGVIKSVMAFADHVAGLGLDARIGGVEYGDGLRTETDLTTPAAFHDWADKLGEIGGGDAPENPIDAILHANEAFTYRRDAQRYVILITDAGMHELSDGSQCADHGLTDVVAAMRGKALFAVAHSTAGGDAGVSPKYLTQALGGLYVEPKFNAFSKSTFDLSKDAGVDAFLAATHRVEVPAERCARDPSGGDPRSNKANLLDSVTVSYQVGDKTYTANVPLRPAP